MQSFFKFSIFFVFCLASFLSAAALAGQTSSNKRSLIRDLPWSRYEVENISGMLGGDSYFSEDASEKVFKEKAPSYGIIHLATHAIVNDESPSYSKLIMGSGGSSNEDGILYTYELYNLQLTAKLVVLSSCRTGGGKLINGEGIFSIARAFIYAGVPSIILSLWDIDDRSTAEIMVDFYRQLSQGKTKAAALRNAKLNYLANSDQLTANPVYWAGLVSLGDQSSIMVNQPGSILPYLIIAAVILAVAVVIIFRKKLLSFFSKAQTR